MWPCPEHNAPAVSLDALVVKISQVFEVVATGAYYPLVATTGAYFVQNGEIRI